MAQQNRLPRRGGVGTWGVKNCRELRPEQFQRLCSLALS